MKQMRPLFRRILFVMSFGLLALALTLFFQGVWAALVITNLKASPAIPWAVALMALFLWLGWKYASGKWRPRSTAAGRRRYLRANRGSGRVFGWAALAGALSLVALVGLVGNWIVMFQLVKMPGNHLPDFSRYPLITVALMLTMACLYRKFHPRTSGQNLTWSMNSILTRLSSVPTNATLRF